jgi:hypothetical protein
VSAAGGAAPRGPAAAPTRIPDAVQIKAILRATLRRATRGRMMASRSSKPRGLIFVLAMYAVLGFILSLVVAVHPDIFTFELLVGSYTFLLAGMTMVAESSTLLFDPSENDILGHRPIHPRTLLIAKSAGLFLLAMLLGLAVNLCPMFAGVMANGSHPWYPAAHLVSLVALVFFSSAAVVFVYALLAKLVSRQTFDTIASWSQVAVTVVLIVSYQLVPRLMNRAQGLRIDTAHPLLLVLPPAWFAALTQVLMGDVSSPRTLILAATAVVVTPVLAWAAIRYLAADYARQLAALSETAGRAKPRRESQVGTRGRLGLEALIGPWLRDPIERAAFRLTRAYLARDRDIRMRTYPSLATMLIFPVIAILDRSQGHSRFGGFMSVYFAGILPATVMMTLKMSPQYAAADLFHYSPLRGTASIFHGVRKAILVLLVVPGLIASGLILWFGLHDPTSLTMAVPALIALPTLSLVDGLAGNYLPLSVPPTGGRQGAINLGMMLIGGVWLAIAIGLSLWAERGHWFWQLVGVEVLVLAIIHPLLLQGIRVRALRPLED